MNKVIKAIRNLSEESLQILYHSSGLESNAKMYRDYYNCSPEDSNLLSLVDRGYMVGPQHIKNKSSYFYLTSLGKEICLTIKKGETAKNSKFLKGRK